MEILKDIEKNILNINMYSKETEPTKLNLIKKQIGDYNKYKSDEYNVISQKIMKYDELYRNKREMNDYEYELYLGRKEELYNIYREAGTLDTLYEYLNCKYEAPNVPEIYTYAHINLNEREKVVKDDKAAKDAKSALAADKCPEGKILNPKTKRCVKDPSYKKPKALKEPKEPKEPKVVPKEAPKDEPKEEPKVVPKEAPKAPPKEPKAPKVKECPEGKILNPKTNRCIKDPSYKKPKDVSKPE
jgi:hypothetical protein